MTRFDDDIFSSYDHCKARCKARQVIKIVVIRWISLSLLLLMVGSGCEAPLTHKPDILIIMPDQMRGDGLSTVDHPVVRTPHMDELAETGALFRRAYTESPSCIPARYAMLTGLSPHTSGVVGFTETQMAHPTMPEIFREAGYLTALVGRSMHQQNSDQDLGYERVLQGSAWGKRDDDYAHFLRNHLSPGTPLGRALHEDSVRSMVAEMGLTYNHWQAEPWPLEEAWHPINWIVRESQQLVDKAPSEQPLFLTASIYAPHSPLFPARRFFDAYLEMDLPDPVRGEWVDWNALRPPPGHHRGSRVQLEGETLRRAQAGYFGLIEHIDEAIGPLIAAFKARSERAGRPWVIIITSDHGEMLGDHGYFRKTEPYEGSANIPFIITASEELDFRSNMRSYHPVGLQDIMPTLADIADISTPEVDGVSLLPLLRGEAQDVRPWLHFEHSPAYSDTQAFHALTDGRFKYIWRPVDGSDQLFDLENDPYEEQNLAGDPAHSSLVEKWRNRLVERLTRRPEGFSDGERLIPGRPYNAHQPGKSGITP